MLPEGMKKGRGVMWDYGGFERLALWNLLSYKGPCQARLKSSHEDRGRRRKNKGMQQVELLGSSCIITV